MLITVIMTAGCAEARYTASTSNRAEVRAGTSIETDACSPVRCRHRYTVTALFTLNIIYVKVINVQYKQQNHHS